MPGLPTVAVRMPSHPVARAIIEAAGRPLAAPSANRSGSPSPTTAAHVLADMEGRIAAVVDGGPCSVGVESTVVDLTPTLQGGSGTAFASRRNHGSPTGGGCRDRCHRSRCHRPAGGRAL